MNTVPTIWSRRLGATLALAAAVSLLYFLVPSTAAACGSIVGSEDEWLSGVSFSALPISDCTNPFGVTDTGVRGRLLVQGSEVSGGGSVVVSPEGTSDIRFEYRPSGDELYNIATWQLFRRDSDDYRYTPVFSRSLTLAEYRAAAVAFLPAGTDVDRFITAYEQNDTTEFDDNPDLLALYEDLLNYFDTLPKKQPDPILPGSYVLVVRESYLTFSQRNPVWEFFVPSAHAQVVLPDRVTTLQFTLAEDTPSPSGASSVLFLPGIQSSRLYKEGLVFEDQVWEPTTNEDIRDLVFTPEGTSLNPIYTNDVLDEVYGFDNVYKSFLNQMAVLQQEGVIKEFSPFAYDWRYDVYKIATEPVAYPNGQQKRLLDEVRALAEDSYTGKVTIIAHSNGGLVAKALLDSYGEGQLAGLVDKLVLVGTPQLGTPKALGVLLHGMDQQAAMGYLIDDLTARTVARQFPGTYTLLPSEEYFEVTGDVVLSADNSSSTQHIRAYGQVNSEEDQARFLVDALDVLSGNIFAANEPIQLDSRLVTEAQAIHRRLADWHAPEGLEVYEVVGTGVPTIKAIEYREFGCSDGNGFCVLSKYAKPFPIMTTEGDETVIATSAMGYDGEKVTLKVDLFEEGEQFLTLQHSHYDLTESRTVREFLDSVIRYRYLSDVLVVPEYFSSLTRRYTIIGTHSPVYLMLTTTDGKKLGGKQGEIKTEIDGGHYFELGGSRFAVIPEGIDYQATIEGDGEGVYGLTVGTLQGDKQEMVHQLQATSSLNMVAGFTSSGGELSIFEVDTNGDGRIDRTFTLDGQEIVIPKTYADLKSAIRSLSGLSRAQRDGLLVLATTAERLNSRTPSKLGNALKVVALKSITKLIEVYYRQGKITLEARQEILNVINYLIYEN